MKKIILLFTLLLLFLINNSDAQRPKFVPGPDQIAKPRKLDPLKTVEVVYANNDMNSFISNYGSLYCNDGFYVSRKRFLGMFSTLGLSAQCDDASPVCYGMRVYPALNANSIYLVFMGETYSGGDTTTMRNNKPYFTLKCGVDELPMQIDPDEIQRIRTENDIEDFQSQYGNSDFKLKSFAFSVKEYGNMLDSLDAIVPPKPEANKLYYIRFRPAYFRYAFPKNKLYLVTSEEERTVNPTTGTYTTISYNKPGMWYNHMDPCPDKCPTNQIESVAPVTIKKKKSNIKATKRKAKK